MVACSKSTSGAVPTPTSPQPGVSVPDCPPNCASGYGGLTISPMPSYVPYVPPKPGGTFTSSCDYILGDFSSKTATGYRFVAGATLHNTGNVGTIDRVVATWMQLGTAPIVMKKTIKDPYHGTRTVGFTYPASQDELSLLQAAQNQPNYCTVKDYVVGNFGPVHG